MTNLLDNAVKWSPPGGTVRVQLEGDRLRVADQGPGIAEADLPYIFDRFYRGDTARQHSRYRSRSLDCCPDDHSARRLDPSRPLGSGRGGVHCSAAGSNQSRGADRARGIQRLGRPTHPARADGPYSRVSHGLRRLVVEPATCRPFSCRNRSQTTELNRFRPAVSGRFPEGMTDGSRRRAPTEQHDVARRGSQPRDRRG